MIFQEHIPVNTKSKKRFPSPLWRFGAGGVLLACGTMIGYRMFAAQTVLAPVIPAPPVQPQDQLNQVNEMDVFQPAGQAEQNTLPDIFIYGPLQLRPHFDYHFMYGNGVQSAPGDQQSTIVQEFSPGLMIDLGPHWVLDYTPTLRFYSDKNFKDGVDHNVTLTGGVNYDAWRFGLSHNTQITSAPTIETGAQTDQTTHSTSLTATRALTDNMSTDLSLNQNITLVSGFQDSYDWNTMDWLNYQFWPRLNAGIGVGGGYVLIEGNGDGNGQALGQTFGVNNADSDQTYEELQARVNWRATDKISLQINGGLEDRQFQTAGAGDSLDPIYGVGIQYLPFKYTQISLNANRTASSSDFYLAAQQVETTIVSLSLSQRLLQKFNLLLGASYTKDDYNSGAVAVNRSDDVLSFNATLSHPFYKRGTWSVYYQYQKDDSSQAGFGFESNQVGFEISYRY